MGTLYIIAKGFWRVAKWVWTAIVVVILTGVASTFLGGNVRVVVDSTVTFIITWFREPQLLPRFILFLLGFLVLVSLAAGLLATILKKAYEKKEPPSQEVQAMIDYFKQESEATQQKEAAQQARAQAAFTLYLHTIENALKTIQPRGFARLTRTLMLADVPLDRVFIPPRIVFDAPVYDAPDAQQRLLTALNSRNDLAAETRSAYTEGLRAIWYSQIRRDIDEKQAQQPRQFTELFRRLTVVTPIAVLLGVPGSGKTTLLHWLAWNMAYVKLNARTSLPIGLGNEQIPILIQTNEYAEQLTKEPLSLKEFLTTQWGSIHASLPLKLREELEQGHCLVLFDGLDQGATFPIRRRVMQAIQAFITEYTLASVPDTYNRFIIASRIADSEPDYLAAYPHYTLLEPDQLWIEKMVTSHCIALARHRIMASKGMQPLTEQEETDARAMGVQMKTGLYQILKNTPDLMNLASNPLALTVITFLQASGWSLRYQRMEVYQMIVRTLLDTWNQESGRTMFSSEEMGLAENLLSIFAYRLQEQNVPLSTHEVKMITRQAMADRRNSDEIKDGEVAQFIETLRRGSGLFIEGGENLYYFANCTFQHYFAAQYLLHMPQATLQQFMERHYYAPSWHESLLLALIYKSRQSNRDEANTSREILQAILAPQYSPSSPPLSNEPNAIHIDEARAGQRAIFVGTYIIEGGRADNALQQTIADSMFRLFRDPRFTSSSAQHYRSIQSTLASWLDLQSQGSMPPDVLPPLIVRWCGALSTASEQAVAIQLLTESASHVLNLPIPALYALVAPLAQLAQFNKQAMPAVLRIFLPQPAIRATSQGITKDAQRALQQLVSLSRQRSVRAEYSQLFTQIAQEMTPHPTQKQAPPPAPPEP